MATRESNVTELHPGEPPDDPKGPGATHRQMRVRVAEAQGRLIRTTALLECMRPLFEELSTHGVDVESAMEGIIEQIEAVYCALDVDAFTGADAHAYDVTGGAA